MGQTSQRDILDASNKDHSAAASSPKFALFSFIVSNLERKILLLGIMVVQRILLYYCVFFLLFVKTSAQEECTRSTVTEFRIST